MATRLVFAGWATALALSFTPMIGTSAPLLPDFGAATFAPNAPIDNPFFPILDSRTRLYQGQHSVDGEVVTESFTLKNVGRGPTILGVHTQAQRDLAFVDGVLQEKTFDYYAQDTAGNVWYLGEDVTEYLYDDSGNLVGTTHGSAWRAGVNGAQPGFIMPANPTVGFEYYQEHSPADAALDQARIFAKDRSLSLPVGAFTGVLQVLETTAVEPTDRAFKYYAPGVGVVLEEEGLNAQFTNPDLGLALIRVVPEPGSLGLGLLALIGVVLIARYGAP
jgi:hypothetical protein